MREVNKRKITCGVKALIINIPMTLTLKVTVLIVCGFFSESSEASRSIYFSAWMNLLYYGPAVLLFELFALFIMKISGYDKKSIFIWLAVLNIVMPFVLLLILIMIGGQPASVGN